MDPLHMINLNEQRGWVRVGIARRALQAATRPVLPADPELRDGDFLVEKLTPDAWLALDASGCIVLITPGRRVTVGNVKAWRDALETAHIEQQVQAALRKDDHGVPA
jgi:hypothetical protein